MPRYFITPTRLVRSPRLAQTIKLMTTLHPERKKDIFVPEATVRWLRSNIPNNWTTISVENAAACVEWREDDLAFPWDADIPRSQKILDLVIKMPEKRHIALQNPYLREETLTLFIEQELVQMAAQEAKKRTESTYSWRRAAYSVDILNAVTRILQNKVCQTYQIEAIWKLIQPQINIANVVVENTSVDKIPDYMLQELVHRILVATERFSYGYTHEAELNYVKEASRRGMLLQATPAQSTVVPQPRPIFSEATKTDSQIVGGSCGN